MRLKCLIQSEKLRLKYRKELKSDKRFALQENDLVRSDFSLVEETLFWSQRSIFLKNFQKNRKNYESLSKRPQQEKNLIKFRFFLEKIEKTDFESQLSLLVSFIYQRVHQYVFYPSLQRRASHADKQTFMESLKIHQLRVAPFVDMKAYNLL